MKNTHTLLILSLIHDLKVPLAVIDFGSQSMLSRNNKSKRLRRRQIEILEKIRADNSHAKQLTSRLLDAATVQSPVRSLVTRASEKIFQKHLKKFLNLFDDSTGSLEQVISRLEKTISGIQEQIRVLKATFYSGAEVVNEYDRIIDRILRNARIALRLIKQAAMLFSGDLKVSKQRVEISELIVQPLIEMFDLKGESFSERLWGATSFDEVKTICSEAGIYFKIDDRLWDQPCNLDKGRINQILVNLLLNSHKFRRSTTGISVNLEKDYLSISVSDDGEGMSLLEESLDIDLKKFASPEDLPVRGHGIGLVGVQAILKQMKGWLTVEPIEGQGATFTVTIPGAFYSSE